MLKIAVHDEEKRGGLLTIWWDGRGAAAILAHNGDALLMECARTECPLLILLAAAAMTKPLE